MIYSMTEEVITVETNYVPIEFLKNNFGEEEYLTYCKNPKSKTSLTKFRLSNHKLRIESDRYKTPRIPPELRICLQCNQHVTEDETHLLLYCDMYNELRTKLFNDICACYCNFHDISDKFIWLMGNKDPFVVIKVATFIHDCLLKRTC